MGEIDDNSKNSTANEKKIPVKLNIAERLFSFRIDAKDEEKIRNAAKMIKDKVLYYRQRYTDRDAQDALSMAALQFVLKLIDAEANKDMQPIQNEIDDLNVRLENYLLTEENTKNDL